MATTQPGHLPAPPEEESEPARAGQPRPGTTKAEEIRRFRDSLNVPPLTPEFLEKAIDRQ